MLRECAVLFFCLLSSVPASAASVASVDALVVDGGGLVRTDGGRINNKAWGQSTVEVRADGETKIVSMTQGLTAPERVLPPNHSDSVVHVRANAGDVRIK